MPEAPEIQLRSEVTGIQQIYSFQDAFDIIKRDKTIWKISFNYQGERYRLVFNDEFRMWENRPIKMGNLILGETFCSTEFVQMPELLVRELVNIGFPLKRLRLV